MLNQAPFRYSNVQIELDAPLEDDAPLGALQLDFANKVIGGGVLGRVNQHCCYCCCPFVPCPLVDPCSFIAPYLTPPKIAYEILLGSGSGGDSVCDLPGADHCSTVHADTSE